MELRHRFRFEPIDVVDKDDFEELYKKIRKIINKQYEKDHDEIMPDIQRVYPVDENGFPLNPEQQS